jgi:hypothetical protein
VRADPVRELKARLREDLLPQFCTGKELSPSAFRWRGRSFHPSEAQSFLRALDLGIVRVEDGARFALPGGHARPTPFWHGQKGVARRRVLLAREAIVAVGAAGDLHLEYGYPSEHLAFEAPGGVFDLVAYADTDRASVLVAGEAKSTPEGLVRFLAQLTECVQSGPHEGCRRLAHPKYKGLVAHRPPLLWALAPGYRRSFAVGGTDGRLQLTELRDLPAYKS